MCKYPSSITLPNRYGLDIFLEYLQDEIYLLKGDLNCLSVIGMNEETKNVVAVDPSGGPFITVGFVPKNGLIVTKINFDNNNYLIELRHVSK